VLYAFDRDLEEKEIFQLKYPVPYPDVENLSATALTEKTSRLDALEFGHSLEDKIDAGFMIT